MASKKTDRIDRHIGRRIADARSRFGESPAKLGAALGLSRVQIDKYEQARSRVPARTLWRIAQRYGRDLMWFVPMPKTTERNHAKRAAGRARRLFRT